MGNTIFLGSNQQAVFSVIFRDFSLSGLVFIVLRDEIAMHTLRESRSVRGTVKSGPHGRKNSFSLIFPTHSVVLINFGPNNVSVYK